MQAVALFMIIEHFNGNAEAIYKRFHDRGRLAPEGLTYLSSWIDVSLDRCYQVMKTDDPALLEQWMAHWRDLMTFEVHEVITSPEAAARIFAGGAAPDP
jgi:hypothetical protein